MDFSMGMLALFPPSLCLIHLTYDYLYSFWSYEYLKRYLTTKDEDSRQTALKILLCGGVAGIVTWASVFPLDVVKTRLQAQTMGEYELPRQQPITTTAAARTINQCPEGQPLLHSTNNTKAPRSSFQLAKEAYRTEGLQAFYRGLGICSFRAFIVNAVQVCLRSFDALHSRLLFTYKDDPHEQWATYEWIMKVLNDKPLNETQNQISLI